MLNNSAPRHRGFTLIELMITVAVIGVLVAIALPSYRDQVAKGKRSAAKSVLMQSQQWMERFYSENYRYDINLVNTAVTDSTLFPAQFSTAPPAGEGGAAYTISVVATSRSYTVTAVPLTAMASDKCGTYRINQTGRKSVLNYASSFGSALEAARFCWQ
jgi:type IV pilus assembly protein PilE